MNNHHSKISHYNRWSLQAAILIMGLILAVGSMAANMPNIGKSTALNPKGFSKTVHHPRYGDMPAYLIEINNGKLLPSKLVVPAKTKFRIVVRNIGTKPAEFESNKLRQEKVLYMGTESVVVIMPLDRGTYDYFDEFTPGAEGKIIAK